MPNLIHTHIYTYYILHIATAEFDIEGGVRIQVENAPLQRGPPKNNENDTRKIKKMIDIIFITITITITTLFNFLKKNI